MNMLPGIFLSSSCGLLILVVSIEIGIPKVSAVSTVCHWLYLADEEIQAQKR